NVTRKSKAEGLLRYAKIASSYHLGLFLTGSMNYARGAMTRDSKHMTGGLLIVTGHAIWNGTEWVGGFPGEESFYAAHVSQGVALRKEHAYECLAFTGGRTRPKLEAETGGLSEAEGLKNYAGQQKLVMPDDDGIILEPWARDTMENIMFSMCA